MSEKIWIKDLSYNKLESVLTRDIMKIGRGRNAKSYYQNYIGFDIETTSVLTDKYKHAYMYIWTCTINDTTIRGNSWTDWLRLLNLIKSILQPDPKHYQLIFIANLSFEFQFMRKYLNVTDSFFLEEREPLYIIHDNFIEFRDALLITGGNLDYLARCYTTTQKMVGDLDYTIQRNSSDAYNMTPQELQYCDNDTIILSEYSSYYFDYFGRKMGFLPLTQTGILRRITKNLCKAFCKAKKTDISNIMKALYPSENEYRVFMRWLFRGGYVHGAITTAGMILLAMLSVDRQSSYPAALNFDYYPVTKFVKGEPDNFLEDIKTKCVIVIIDFYDIDKTLVHTIESRSKIIEADTAYYDNGRLICAKRIRVMLTELDYDIYTKFYSWSSMKVLRTWTAERGQLPKYMLQPINENYIIKSKLKMEGKSDTIDYINAKVNVNAGYGNAVTRMKENQVTYDSDTDEYVINNQFDYMTEVSKQVLLPQWGIWCTAHARHDLLDLFYQIDTNARRLGRDNDVQYGDTDSIKISNFKDHMHIIEAYNERMRKNLDKMCERFGYDRKYFEGLGEFQTEYYIKKFKHQGAKRYITEYYDSKKKDYVLKCTIAGLPKNALLKYAKSIRRSPLDLFEDNMNIPPEFTKKLCAIYNDEPHSDYVNGELMHEESSVALAPVDFTLNIDDEYIEQIAEEIERKLRRSEV